MKIQITIGLSEELKSFISEILGKETTDRKQAPAALKAVPKEEDETGPLGNAEETTPVVKKKKKKIIAAEPETKEDEKPDLLGGAKKPTTTDDVRAKLQPIVDSGGFHKVQTALKNLGAESLLVLDASKYDELLKSVLG